MSPQYTESPHKSVEIVERRCDTCGESFTVPTFRLKDRPVRFCSRECFNKWRRRDRVAVICPVCAVTFYLTACEVGTRVTCGNACRTAQMRQGMDRRTCPHCGKEYATHAKSRAKHCSRACELAAKDALTTITCLVCGKQFTYYKSSNRRYCSVACTGIGLRRANHYGRGHRPYRLWRESVLERDHFTCQKCGATDKQLEAHHVQSWRHNPALRFDVRNGLALCEACHDAVHSRFSAHYRPTH